MGFHGDLGYKKTISSTFQFLRSLSDILATKWVFAKTAILRPKKKTFFEKPPSWGGKNYFFTEIFFLRIFQNICKLFLKNCFRHQSIIFDRKTAWKSDMSNFFPKNVKNCTYLDICDIFWKKLEVALLQTIFRSKIMPWWRKRFFKKSLQTFWKIRTKKNFGEKMIFSPSTRRFLKKRFFFVWKSCQCNISRNHCFFS